MDTHLMAMRSSHLSSVRRCGVFIMLLAAPLILASSAYADVISVGFQEAGVNGGAITTIATGSGALSLGPIAYGTFSVNQANVEDFGVLPASGLLNSNILDISTARAGVLTVWVTAQGATPSTAITNFISSFAVNSLSGGIVQVTETTYISLTNGLYGGTILDSALFNAIGTKGPDNTLAPTPGTYSVTHQYVIFDTAGTPGSDNLTIDLSGVPVPEPASLGLIGAGLLGIFALKFRR